MLKNEDFQIALRKQLAKEGKFRYVGIPTSKGTVRVSRTVREWFLVDLNGKPISTTFQHFYPFSCERSIVTEGNLRYFLDEEGNPIGKGEFYEIYTYSEGLAAVAKKGRLYSKWGFINKHGKEVIALNFEFVHRFCESVAWVKLNGWYYLIDKSGKQLTKTGFSTVNDFFNGVATANVYNPQAAFSSGPYFIINKKGKAVSEQSYSYIGAFSEGVAPAVPRRVYTGRDHILIDKEGNRLTPNSYDYLSKISDGFAVCMNDGKEAYIDFKGNQLCQFYCYLHSFSEGLGCVTDKNKKFFIDVTGKKVFSDDFDFANSFEEGVAQVKKNGEMFYIDHTGERVF